MKQAECAVSLEEQSQGVVQAMRTWRTRHPQATLREIEAATDEQMNQMRAHVIEDLAQSSEEDRRAGETRCPECSTKLVGRGTHTRVLQTSGGENVTLTRQYLSCPRCGYSVFPPG